MEGAAGRKEEIDGVAKVTPFLIRKQVAEFAETIGHRFVGAHGLGSVNIIDSPLKALCHVLEAEQSCRTCVLAI